MATKERNNGPIVLSLILVGGLAAWAVGSGSIDLSSSEAGSGTTEAPVSTSSTSTTITPTTTVTAAPETTVPPTAPPTTASPHPYMRKGDTEATWPGTTLAEQKLVKLGCLAKGRDDGLFDNETAIATSAFQANTHITVDKEIGPQTQSALDGALAFQEISHYADCGKAWAGGEITPGAADPINPDDRIHAGAADPVR